MFSVLVSSLLALRKTRRLSTMAVSLMGALKIVTDALGWHVISNQEVNAIANGIAAVMTISGVVMTHLKHLGGGFALNAVASYGGALTTPVDLPTTVAEVPPAGPDRP